jgi:hypothetical protein
MHCRTASVQPMVQVSCFAVPRYHRHSLLFYAVYAYYRHLLRAAFHFASPAFGAFTEIRVLSYSKNGGSAAVPDVPPSANSTLSTS